MQKKQKYTQGRDIEKLFCIQKLSSKTIDSRKLKPKFLALKRLVDYYFSLSSFADECLYCCCYFYY